MAANLLSLTDSVCHIGIMRELHPKRAVAAFDDHRWWWIGGLGTSAGELLGR